MKKLRWNPDKASSLQSNKTRGNVTFEDCVIAIENDRILDVVLNPSSNHKMQRMYVLNIRNYAYCVPFVESETEIFLKTVFPSRKFTALLLKDARRD